MNAEKTKVSIVMPVYNTGPYLAATIDSLRALDGGVDYEFVCVDDGSTDASPEMLRRWAEEDPRVVLLSQANQGQSVARNAALPHVGGEWVYFMDSDDLVVPGAIAQAVEAGRLAQAEMVLFEADVMAEDGTPVDSDRYVRPAALAEGTTYTGEAVMHALLADFRFRAVPWLYVVRTDFLRRSGLSFVAGIIHEDEPFTAALTLAAGSIAVLHRRFVAHRLRRTSTMGAAFSARNMDCYLAGLDAMQAWMKAHPEHRRAAWDYCRYTLSHVLITARALPFGQRLRALRRIARSGYLPYAESKRLVQFVLGRRRPPQSYINSLVNNR